MINEINETIDDQLIGLDCIFSIFWMINITE